MTAKIRFGHRDSRQSWLETKLVAEIFRTPRCRPHRHLYEYRQFLTQLRGEEELATDRKEAFYCFPPGYNVWPKRSEGGRQRACHRYRWCPFCFVRQIPVAAWNRLLLVPPENTAWRFCWTREGSVDDYEKFLRYGDTFLYCSEPLGWFYLTDLVPGPQDDLLQLRHQAIFLQRPGGHWIGHFRSRLRKEGVETYVLEPRGERESWEAFVGQALTYTRRWLTGPTEVTALLATLEKRTRYRLRCGGLLRGCRRTWQAEKVTRKERPR